MGLGVCRGDGSLLLVRVGRVGVCRGDEAAGEDIMRLRLRSSCDNRSILCGPQNAAAHTYRRTFAIKV